MIKKQSIAKNYIYQFVYQGLIIVIPFILSPYLTRTLGSRSLGTYTFVHSISYYFVIVANLGIGVHGKRLISRNAHDQTALRKSFWSLFTVHGLISAAALLIYLVYIAFFVKEDRIIYFIETAYVVSALFDITWLFYGLENFKSVVLVNTFIKVSECILIFLLIKSPSDTAIYTMITAGGFLLGQAVLIPLAFTTLKPIRFTAKDAAVHIKPMLVFSVAVVATSLYTVFDKTLLGLMTTKENVAFYEYSNKIVHIPKTFIEIVSTVMFPRACKLAAQGKKDEQKRYMEYSFFATAFMGMGAVFGLMAVAELFAVIYYGAEFRECGRVIISLAPLIYIISAGKILRSQCLIPNGMDKQFNLCIVYNAIINLVISIVLIPYLGIYGAVIGTTAAEIFGFSYQMVLCRQYISVGDIGKTLAPFLLIGAAMFSIVRFVGKSLPATVTGLITQVVAGVVVYCVLCVGYCFLFQRDFVSDIVGKLKAKKTGEESE